METVVLYPFPGIGHLISMVELGKLLLSHKPSLSITILLPTFPFKTATTSPYISSVSSAFPSITFHSLPAVPLCLGDPSNYTHMEEIGFESLRNDSPNIRQFLQSLCQPAPVSAFILDFFCYPALQIAQSFNIPTYCFFTSGAAALALFLNFPDFDKMAPDSFMNLGSKLFEIPGLFPVPASHMIDSMLDGGAAYRGFVEMGAHLPKFDGIIINTFESLEPRAVESLKQGTCLLGSTVPSVYCMGPLLAKHGESNGEKEGKKVEILSWLDSQPSKSVVYLGFGSLGMFSVKQTREIAIGLERSGVRFLWIVRAPPSKDKAKRFLPPPEPDLNLLLPTGFLDRTKDRGLVVKSWAPQIAILGHEAVGGFVTHCGWNSILEAVSAGVPLVAWPLYAEQRFNKIVLVEELKIALPMDMGEDRFVSSDEIRERVKQVISSEEEEICSIRKRVKNLSRDAKVALGDGGSSEVALARFLESWDL